MDNIEDTIIENIIRIAERVGRKLPFVKDNTNEVDPIFLTDVEVLVDQITQLTNTINKKV